MEALKVNLWFFPLSFFIARYNVPDRSCSFTLGLIEESVPALTDTYKSEKLTLVGINPEISELVFTSE